MENGSIFPVMRVTEIVIRTAARKSETLKVFNSFISLSFKLSSPADEHPDWIFVFLFSHITISVKIVLLIDHDHLVIFFVCFFKFVIHEWCNHSTINNLRSLKSFLDKILAPFYHFTLSFIQVSRKISWHAFCMPRPSHTPCFDHRNDMLWRTN